jgi:hypothetical protein
MARDVSESIAIGHGLRASTVAVRSQVLDLLQDATSIGLARDANGHEVVARLQRASNDLGEALRWLAEAGPESRDPLEAMEPQPSGDAAVVLTLASLTVPPTAPNVDKAERWLRIMRLYGRVGATLLRLGVPDGPVATVAAPVAPSSDGGGKPASEEQVVRCAAELARACGAATVDTVHVFFAVRQVFGSALDRALYHRGTSWEQFTATLTLPVARSVQA